MIYTYTVWPRLHVLLSIDHFMQFTDVDTIYIHNKMNRGAEIFHVPVKTTECLCSDSHYTCSLISNIIGTCFYRLELVFNGCCGYPKRALIQ